MSDVICPQCFTRIPRNTPEERFWSCVDTHGECWVWLGGIADTGYGRVFITKGVQLYSHRVSWELLHGKIEDGMFVCHKCDNRLCVNPSHLFLGTHLENIADRVSKNRTANKRQPKLVNISKTDTHIFCPTCEYHIPYLTATDKFWAKVDKSGDCWVWTASLTTSGYGNWNRHRAHRISWELLRGKIMDGMHLLHMCDNRLCVNPDHLFLGTNTDNVKDKVSKGRQQQGNNVHCAKLTPEMVRNIRREYATGSANQRILASMYGVSYQTIQALLTGRTWKHVL